MAEYIERDKIIKIAVSAGLCDAQGNMRGAGDVVLVDDIKAIPAADVAPSIHGCWVVSDTPCERFKCSECGGGCWYYDYQGDVAKSRYCPNCGAKMDKEE